jgi:integration host factor subunit alpha
LPQSLADRRIEEVIAFLGGGEIGMDGHSENKMTLTKADLVDKVLEGSGLSKREATDVVEHIFDQLKITLAQTGKVKLSGFGNFVVRRKKARVGRNPQTGDEMMISARAVLTFKPSQVLKAMLNKDLPQRRVEPAKTSVIS